MVSEHHFDRIVIGGGAMGLATAWRIAALGRSVLMLEQFERHHQQGASHGATRNFNNAYTDAHYLDLLERSFQLYRELEAATGSQLLDLCGLVTHGDAARVSASHAALTRRGIDASILEPSEAARRWPGMRFDSPVLHSNDAGRIFAARTLDALAGEAQRHGAVLRWESRVERVEGPAQDVPDDAASAHAARHQTQPGAGAEWTVHYTGPDGVAASASASGLVFTAGAWSAPLLAAFPGIGERLPALRVTEEHPAHFAALPSLSASHVSGWPSFNHVAPVVAGERSSASVYGMFTPGEGIKVGFHRVGEVVDPDHRPHEAPPQSKQQLTDYVSEWMPGLDPATPEWVSCTYTSTPSEAFVLDRVGDVTIGAGFSGQGFKFVPAVGDVLAKASLGLAAPDAAWSLSTHGASQSD